MNTNNIKMLRTIAGITQAELADAAHISRPYLYDLENGNRGAKPETMQRIADALGCTVDDLLKEDGKEEH